MAYKVYRKGGYLYIVDTATDREYSGRTSVVYVTRGKTTTDVFFFNNIENWSNSMSIAIGDIQDFDGNVYTVDSFISFYEAASATTVIVDEDGIPDYRITYAIDQVLADDGVHISVSAKNKSLIKFGENDDLDLNIEETIWATGGIETLQTSNTIDEVVSADNSDTQDIVIEGHTLSGTDFTFVNQTATLTGLTPVTLTTPLARVSRMYNDDSTDFAGVVTVEASGGGTHLTSIGNQSLKCATTLSSTDYWIITSITYSVNRKRAAKIDFGLQVKEYGKVFRLAYGAEGADTSGTHQIFFDQPIIVRPNSDVRMTGISSENDTQAQASIHGYLAKIVD
jgi:hypothetical protein